MTALESKDKKRKYAAAAAANDLEESKNAKKFKKKFKY